MREIVILVPDVDKFPGHIACNPYSRSEVVVPLMYNGKCVGVMDADSDKLNDFDKVINYSEKIKEKVEFKKSKAQFYYGLSLKELGRLEEAEIQLRVLDQRYSNYNERVTLAKFLMEIGKKEDAKELLNDIYTESKHMTRQNKRNYKSTILEVESLLKTF